jgi:hypothetical protein
MVVNKFMKMEFVKVTKTRNENNLFYFNGRHGVLRDISRMGGVQGAGMYKASQQVPDTPGVCVIYAHGFVGYVSSTRYKKDHPIDATELKEIIDKNCSPKIPVQLMSCDGGTGGDESIASKLAKESGRTVSGYDGKVLYIMGLWPFPGSVEPVPGVKNRTYTRR